LASEKRIDEWRQTAEREAKPNAFETKRFTGLEALTFCVQIRIRHRVAISRSSVARTAASIVRSIEHSEAC